MNKIIYLDNAATTIISPEVLNSMMPYLEEKYGNASGIYQLGRESKTAVDKAREQIANAIGAKPTEVFFTGSGTEADNWAIIGTALANREKGKHIITTIIEHHAVLHTCEYLEKNGFEITYLPVSSNGIINTGDLEKEIRDDTILISVMYANNEIGTIQPIDEIGKIAKEHNILFHTDAVQAVGILPINVEEQHIDMLSLSGHKINAPKGIGVLYVREGVNIDPFIHGGQQENDLRAGTENVAGIVGLGTAIGIKVKEREEEYKRLKFLSDKLIDGILNSIQDTKLNGDRFKRLPNNVNISFGTYVNSESLLLKLDLNNIMVSTGSACNSGEENASHVLCSLDLSCCEAKSSIRFTLGRYNTEEEIDFVIEKLQVVVKELRDISVECKDEK